ncbi:hypothetical protein GGC64_006214 [Mycobacterium sp. OAS707]|nr:hypothetical protein [Mycobacterium sp. OAS707]
MCPVGVPGPITDLGVGLGAVCDVLTEEIGATARTFHRLEASAVPSLTKHQTTTIQVRRRLNAETRQ